jgi:hypothetical protein
MTSQTPIEIWKIISAKENSKFEENALEDRIHILVSF